MCDSWHAHIYYNAKESKETATVLRKAIGIKFPEVILGRWHDKSVGPHLAPMYQVAFKADQFGVIVPWLVIRRDGLSILIHPNTDNPWRDHVVLGFWLGEKLSLNEFRLQEMTTLDSIE
ncbi:MAG: 4,5-dioxygenase [Rhodospirillaceae bacterium]|nr:4,5-dioxygenase [Rhodospirillaceae bacterium]|tara:strand:- start:3206 stop:3562 length:357 start_codon:yes stop_codon:yes gene_type:complete